MSEVKLTAKQEKFCQEYMVDLNATQAALRSGYSEHSSKQIGTENIAKPAIQARIAELQKKASKKVEVTVEMLLQEYKRIGFGDPRKIITWSGDTSILKPSDELTDDEIAMVSGVVQKKGKYGDTVEIKFNDKIAALDKLAKHLGFYKEVIDINKTVSISDEDKAILDRLGVKVDD
jgi:phage terminase small subunit